MRPQNSPETASTHDDITTIRRSVLEMVTEPSRLGRRKLAAELLAALGRVASEVQELRALVASDEPTAALARERMAAHKTRERLEGELEQREQDKDAVFLALVRIARDWNRE